MAIGSVLQNGPEPPSQYIPEPPTTSDLTNADHPQI